MYKNIELIKDDIKIMFEEYMHSYCNINSDIKTIKLIFEFFWMNKRSKNILLCRL